MAAQGYRGETGNQAIASSGGRSRSGSYSGEVVGAGLASTHRTIGAEIPRGATRQRSDPIFPSIVRAPRWLTTGLVRLRGRVPGRIAAETHRALRGQDKAPTAITEWTPALPRSLKAKANPLHKT